MALIKTDRQRQKNKPKTMSKQMVNFKNF